MDALLGDAGLIVMSLTFALLGLLAAGRWAWLAVAAGAALLVGSVLLTGSADIAATVVFSVPPYLMGRLVRLRKNAERGLRIRVRELEDERALYSELAVQAERGRIAGELHDLVGHALSVMVIQAAAGQRLVGSPAADDALTAIAVAARQGEDDLARLQDLIAEGNTPGGALPLIDAMIERARAGGMAVQYTGVDDQVPAPIGHLAYRIVQESLTNALRHAPGAWVDAKLGVRTDRLQISVESGPATAGAPSVLPGGGAGLLGLSERVAAVGGTFRTAATARAGWQVVAELPLR